MDGWISPPIEIEPQPTGHCTHSASYINPYVGYCAQHTPPV